MTFREYIQQSGYEPVDPACYAKIEEWDKWYRGKVDKFHNYTIYNAGRAIRRTRASLSMAKQGCEFWASLLWNDECYITLNDEAADAEVNRVLRENDFWRQLNQLTEKAFALGTGAVIAFEAHGAVRLDYIPALHIYPLSWRNSDIESCAFVGQYNRGKERLLYVMIHELQTGGGYKVFNKFFHVSESTDQITPADVPDGILEEYRTAAKRFAIVKPNIANNAWAVPLGLSVYANCIDTLKSIDLAYDGAKTAMELGRPRIGVSSNGLRVDIKDGEVREVFDSNDIAVYDIGSGKDADKVLVEDLTTEYRADKFEQSLQTQLNIYAQAIGLGDKAFRWQQDSVSTATQVIADNSSMLRAMEKHQMGLRDTVCDVVAAVLDIKGLPESIETTVTFDDSVTRDKGAERARFWQFVVGGHFPFWKYLVEFEGYSEDDARSLEAEAGAGQPVMFPDTEGAPVPGTVAVGAGGMGGADA